ncbi:MAG: glycosyltransferase family 25 protein [Lyngbya sp.]|nr:glycosyltransferase family 25 protein [Lyngbya sp.]
MKLIDYFERAYVINLPERTDRRQLITQELEKAEIPLTPNQVEIFPAIRPDDAGEFPSIGARGCFLSHLSILKKAKLEGVKNLLVMEDDLTLSPQFNTHQETLINQLSQKNWGFVYFGHKLNLNSSDEVKLVPHISSVVTAHFYAVNGHIFESLIQFLETLLQRPGGHLEGGPMHVDGAFSTFRRKNPTIPTWVASPSLGGQRSSRSDITPNKFDDFPVLRPFIDIARNTKNQLARMQLFS